MSPTYYAVQMRAAQQQLDHARKENNIPGMQAALSVMTGLTRSCYGASLFVN